MICIPLCEVYNTELLPPPLPDSAPPLDNNRMPVMVAGPKWYHDSFDSTSSDGQCQNETIICIYSSETEFSNTLMHVGGYARHTLFTGSLF